MDCPGLLKLDLISVFKLQLYLYMTSESKTNTDIFTLVKKCIEGNVPQFLIRTIFVLTGKLFLVLLVKVTISIYLPLELRLLSIHFITRAEGTKS